jgi:hypothetical protein
MVLGVIAIVFGSLGILGGILGAVMLLVAGDQVSGHMGGAAGIANQVLGFALSVLLLAAGIGLAARRRWAPPAMLIWAVLAIVAALFGTIIGYQVQQEQMEELQNQGAGAAPAWISSTMPLFMLLGMLWALALPVFMLIWLRRPVIRAETATWR